MPGHGIILYEDIPTSGLPVNVPNGICGLDGAAQVAVAQLGNVSTFAFVQNGNSFGAIAVLGTNDAFDVAFETGGIEQMRLTTGGALVINNTAPLGTELFRIAGGTAIVDFTSAAALQILDSGGTAGAVEFVFDTLNKRLGFSEITGSFAPTEDIHVEKEGAIFRIRGDVYSSTGADNLCMVARRAGGTKAAPTALVDDMDILEFAGLGYDGVGFSGQQIVILFEAAGAWTATAHGTRQLFKVTDRTDVTVTQHETLVLADDFCVIVTGGTDGLSAAVAGEVLRIEGDTRFVGGMVMAGDFDFTPTVDDDGELGTDALRWTRVRAVTVVTGDLELRDDERGAHWVVREEPDAVTFLNKKTGKKFRAVMEEIVE